MRAGLRSVIRRCGTVGGAGAWDNADSSRLVAMTQGTADGRECAAGEVRADGGAGTVVATSAAATSAAATSAATSAVDRHLPLGLVAYEVYLQQGHNYLE